MKEKTKLRVIQILCIVSLLITVFSIQRTYAKYYEQVDTNYATNIKRWAIKIKDTYIHGDGVTLAQVMQPTFIANEHMNSNNTLVPGRLGYFEFDIDYTSVEVPFKFQFDIKQLNTETVVDETTGESSEVDMHLTDFQIYGYSIIEGEGESQTEAVTTLATINDLAGLTQYIDPNNEEHLNNDNEKKRKIRILFKWYDGEDNTMNNAADTAYAGYGNSEAADDGIHKLLKYNVKITFTQTV